MNITILPAYKDNYIYILHCDQTHETAVIDPGEAGPVLDFLNETGWSLTQIWLTHHHWDHINGAEDLKDLYPEAKMIGAAADAHRLPDLDIALSEGDEFDFAGTRVQILETPGHTLGHIAYYVPAAEALFCGDTVFSLSCGRLFEGSAADMWSSLQKIRALPPETKIYCGHEYTAMNCKFAKHIQPDNPALEAYIAKVKKLRANKQPTMPMDVATESACNPFFQCDSPAIAETVGLKDTEPSKILAELRHLKDNF